MVGPPSALAGWIVRLDDDDEQWIRLSVVQYDTVRLPFILYLAQMFQLAPSSNSSCGKTAARRVPALPDRRMTSRYEYCR